MSDQHRVAGHLGVTADDYDRTIRTFIPNYERMIATPVADKKLQWIEGTAARFDGYLEFQRRPQPMLDWFARYMS
jgi:hypothetical protein